MSIIVTLEEINYFRTELSEYSDALIALDVLEDCEGDLDDAAIALAIQCGQQPDTSDRWIDGLAKRWRHIICQPELKEAFEDGLSGTVLATLTTSTNLPVKLATPVAIYVVKAGVTDFCQPLTEKL
jgi:hypothetical protein